MHTFYKGTDLEENFPTLESKLEVPEIGKAKHRQYILVMEVVNVFNIAENDAFFSCETRGDVLVVQHRAHVVLQWKKLKTKGTW